MKRIALILAMFFALGTVQPAFAAKCSFDPNKAEDKCALKCYDDAKLCRERFAAGNDHPTCNEKEFSCETACGCEPDKK